MIIREYYATRKDGVNLYKTYSDKDLIIRKVSANEEYDVAIDVEGAPYVYEETDKRIEVPEETKQPIELPQTEEIASE